MLLTIADALAQASAMLAKQNIASLDAEILLADILKVSRSYLYAWSEKTLTEIQQQLFLEWIQRRLQHEPLPYITGHQEFWSLDFKVTPDTLIPRPETELLVELVLKMMGNDQCIVADLGTGSGAIAIAISHEKPRWKIHATDQSPAALEIAAFNAKKLKCENIIFHQGYWCQALPNIMFDMVVSNPPYIAEHDPHLLQGGLSFEPDSALTSGADGLDAIREIIVEARRFLKSAGLLMLEHGYDQAEQVRDLLINAGYQQVASYKDLAGIERVSVGLR
jgi:release factor glutamine methyltransferase